MNKSRYIACVYHLVVLLFFVSCSKSTDTLFRSSNSKATESEVKYAEAELDTISAGEGITVGNGRDDTEEISDNEQINHFLLACVLSKQNNFKCQLTTDVTSADIPKEKITILDEQGNPISSELITYTIVEIDNDKWLDIIVSTEVKAQKILVDGVEKSVESSTEDNTDESVVESSEPNPTLPKDCNASEHPGTWVLVPGDPDYGTSDFCVMKYEAKNNSGSPSSEAAGSPWVMISQEDAITQCASLGAGYHLMTNNEWMTISANLTNVDSNWTAGSVGLGSIFRGHSDNSPNATQGSPCAASEDDSLAFVENACVPIIFGGDEQDETQRRTMNLSNGNVIWDLSGNVWEWIDYFNIDQKPTPNGYFWSEFTEITSSLALTVQSLIPTSDVKPFWNDAWDSTQSIGRFWAGPDSEGGSLHRGGDWNDMDNAGIFSANLHGAPTPTYDAIGFRCTFSFP